MQRLRIVTATASAPADGLADARRPASAGAAQQPPVPQQPVEQRQLQTPPMPLLPNNGLGETDQALIPDNPGRFATSIVRSRSRSSLAARPVTPPSDAVILFDGKDLSQWIVGPARGGRSRCGGAVWGWLEGRERLHGGDARGRRPDVQGAVQGLSAAPRVRLASRCRSASRSIAGTAASRSAGARFRCSTTTTTRRTPMATSRRSTTSGRRWRIRHGRPASGRRWTSPTWRRDTRAIVCVRNAFITIFMNGVMVHNNREIQPRGGGAGSRCGWSAPAARAAWPRSGDSAGRRSAGRHSRAIRARFPAMRCAIATYGRDV